MGIENCAELDELGRGKRKRFATILANWEWRGRNCRPRVSIGFLSSLPIHGILGALARSIVALRPP